MRALIMAGGAGSRLGRGEKALVMIKDQPMIRYVVEAYRFAGCEPVVVTSQKTPMTANWCRAHGLPIVRTEGDGYIEDMMSAVHTLEENRALIISVCDIPCITATTISRIIHEYDARNRDALSTWVPATLVRSCRGGMPYREIVGGVEACPAGVNILRGDLIDTEQEEVMLLVPDPGLALNVNTADDLLRAEQYLSGHGEMTPGSRVE